MRHVLLPLLVLVAAPLARLAAADAQDLAAKVVAARAGELRAAGKAAAADAFAAVATALDKHQVTLDEGARIVALYGDVVIVRAPLGGEAGAPLGVGTVPGPGPVAAAVAPRATVPAAVAPAAVSAEQATAVLDGDLHGAALAAAAAAASPPTIVGTVLAVQKSDVGKPALIVIDGGANKGVAVDREFAIRRGGATLVKAKAVEVKDTMTVCTIVPGSWADEHAEIREGDEAASL